MKLTVKLKKRWITSVLKQANSDRVAMPWERGARRSLSIVRRSGIKAVRISA